MMEIASVATGSTQPGQVVSAETFGELGSEQFLQLLIVQLRTQDPLEPVGNEELLRQISSIRDIELSTSTRDALQQLTSTLGAASGEQRFSAASSFIGQYVQGFPDESGVSPSGVVVGVRIDSEGDPLLRLSNGAELRLSRVRTVEPPIHAARALIGSAVTGVDRREPANPQVIEGVVTSVRQDSGGEVFLELDSGEELRLVDVVAGGISAAA